MAPITHNRRDDTMRGGEFIAEAQDRKLLLRPQAAEALRALITQAVVTPKPVLDRTKDILADHCMPASPP
jgi:hypothetical protein